MKIAKLVLIGAILILVSLAAFHSVELLNLNKKVQKVEGDFAFATKLGYGLFNLDAWKEKAFDAFSDKIKNFEISSGAYTEVESELRSYLRDIYKDYFVSGKLFDQIFIDAEEKKVLPPMMLNMLKKSLPDQIKNLNIEAQIPTMAHKLALELRKKEPKIKETLRGELAQLVTTVDTLPRIDERKDLLVLYKASSLEELPSKINEEKRKVRQAFETQYKRVLTFLGIALFLVIIAFFTKIGIGLVVGLLSLISIIFLVIGVQLPMIVIDARLNAFDFVLLNQNLGFEQQTLFYQSKSILDVTSNLLDGKTFDLKLVGILVLCFSIIFPTIKILLSSMFFFSTRLQSNRFVGKIIFYLGKWSMADVFVVALFMTYIGFYGLVNSQLKGIERNETGFDIETVNYTHLEVGILFFTTYCILSIISGIIIQRNIGNSLSKNP